jgi:hypothetical protein
VPIRRTFLRSAGGQPVAGPLHAFVVGRRSRALDLYMLVHAGASADPWDVRQPAMSWARMLGMPQTASSETSISRNFSWLETQRLVRSERAARLRRVYLLQDDGSGRPYTRPRPGQPEFDRGYFNVPYEYFREGYLFELSLAAKATLLICLAQNPIFTLPTDRAATWYGVSADTLQRGLDELRTLGLLNVWSRMKKAPRARYGVTAVNHYRLLGPFVQRRKPSQAMPDRGSTELPPRSDSARVKGGVV